MADIKLTVDVPGGKEVGAAVEKLTDKSLDGAGAFLGKICLPMAEEIGLLLAEKFSYYRKRNLVSYTEKLRIKLESQKSGDVHAHPRLVYYATEQASLTDDDEVQGLWAGLLASACDASGQRQSSMLYMDLLSRLSPDECRIIEFIASKSIPVRTSKGVELAGFSMNWDDFTGQCGILERELINEMMAHLYAMELVSFVSNDTKDLQWTLKSLGVSFYVRCQGFAGNPDDYFGAVPTSQELRLTGRSLILTPDTLVSSVER